MERLILITLSLLFYSTAQAQYFSLTGVIKEQIAPPELTIDEKPHKYLGLVLDKPIPMNIYSEDTDEKKLFKNVAIVQVGWKGDLIKFKGKKVNLLSKNCINSQSAHIYTDVMCEIEKINVIK